MQHYENRLKMHMPIASWPALHLVWAVLKRPDEGQLRGAVVHQSNAAIASQFVKGSTALVLSQTLLNSPALQLTRAVLEYVNVIK